MVETEEMEMDEEEMEDEESEEPEELSLQSFMNDMRMLGEQVKSKELAKPPFNYGDLSVTNYLLWLQLGELMKLNDKIDNL